MIESNLMIHEELSFKARLKASILWLMSKAYNNSIPLDLLQPFEESSDREYEFKSVIRSNLASGEYYFILLNDLYPEQSSYHDFKHSDVIKLLLDKKIFFDEIDLDSFSNFALSQQDPIALEPHMSIIHGLMTLYIFEILNPSRVTLVCDGFIPVHNDECPEDAEAAALFWLNKACLRKHQEISLDNPSNNFSNKHEYTHDTNISSDFGYQILPPIIHLDDITDISDGCALGFLLSLYCPNDFNWQDIKYGIGNSIHNLERIQHFCRSLLPYNICFLTTEDLLYIDVNLRTNVIAFIADLWYAFVIKPCDLVVIPCRIVEPENLDEMISVLKLSDSVRVSQSNNQSAVENFENTKHESKTEIHTENVDGKPDQNVSNGNSHYTNDTHKIIESPKKLAHAFEINISEDINNKKTSPPLKLVKIKDKIQPNNKLSLTEDLGCNMSTKEPNNDRLEKHSIRQSKNAESFQIDAEIPKTHVTKDKIESKKDTLILLSEKRRKALQAKKAMKECEISKLKAEEAVKRDQQEQRRLENKKRREMILEQYRLKKAAEAENGSIQIEKPKLPPSLSSANLNSQAKQVSQTRKEYTGPKLFAKPASKSNLIVIKNAILKTLEGPPNAKTLSRVQEKIVANAETCRHFLIFFRDSLQYRGLYKYDDKEETITKLDGIGPKTVNIEDIVKFYKFDTPKRQFTVVQTKRLCLTIIAFAISDSYWAKGPTLK